jgi:hypothetical protein
MKRDFSRLRNLVPVVVFARWQGVHQCFGDLRVRQPAVELLNIMCVVAHGFWGGTVMKPGMDEVRVGLAAWIVLPFSALVAETVKTMSRKADRTRDERCVEVM